MEIFLDFLDSRDSGCGLLGALYHNLFNKLCFGVYKIGNEQEIRFQKVEPRLDMWAARGQPTVGFRNC